MVGAGGKDSLKEATQKSTGFRMEKLKLSTEVTIQESKLKELKKKRKKERTTYISAGVSQKYVAEQQKKAHHETILEESHLHNYQNR